MLTLTSNLLSFCLSNRLFTFRNPSRQVRGFLLLRILSNPSQFQRHFCQLKEEMHSPPNWLEEKKKYQQMSTMERRRDYKCGDNYTTIDTILPWNEYVLQRKNVSSKSEPKHADFPFDTNKNQKICRKISIFRGDITTLEVDAIVNAANKSLRGGGGVDGAIHRAAGEFLLAENIEHKGCEVGQVKVSGGYKLPSRYVFNTVGPQGEKPGLLRECYRNSMETMIKMNLKSIAFPCISTGIYGYPLRPAAHIAAQEVRRVMDQHEDRIDRVIFCLFADIDEDSYNDILPAYFPTS